MRVFWWQSLVEGKDQLSLSCITMANDDCVPSIYWTHTWRYVHVTLSLEFSYCLLTGSNRKPNPTRFGWDPPEWLRAPLSAVILVGPWLYMTPEKEKMEGHRLFIVNFFRFWGKKLERRRCSLLYFIHYFHYFFHFVVGVWLWFFGIYLINFLTIFVILFWFLIWNSVLLGYKRDKFLSWNSRLRKQKKKKKNYYQIYLLILRKHVTNKIK